MVVFNKPKLVEESLHSIRHAVGATNLFEAPMRMGAEDFSYYEQVIPGFFLRLGSGNKAKGILTVHFQKDGDLMYSPGTLWTAAHHQLPILKIMFRQSQALAPAPADPLWRQSEHRARSASLLWHA